jgi:hypothetical protein
MIDNSDFDQNDLVSRGVHDFGPCAPINARMGQVEEQVRHTWLAAMGCRQRPLKECARLGADARQRGDRGKKRVEDETKAKLKKESEEEGKKMVQNALTRGKKRAEEDAKNKTRKNPNRKAVTFK